MTFSVLNAIASKIPPVGGRARRQRPIAAAVAMVGAGLLVVAGCEVGPTYKQPGVHAPDAFATTGPSSRPTTMTSATVNERWWTAFGDPMLDSLVARASDGNFDLRQAASRLREARARRAIVAGGQYPQAEATAGYTHQRLSENAAPFNAVTGGFPFEYDLFQLGFDASWELDFFGRVRRDVRAADLDVAASVEEGRSVRLSVIAEIARNYVELRGYQRELAVAQRNLAVQRETVEVTRDRQTNGVATQLDVAQAAGQASATEAQLPAFENQQWQAIHRIALLLGLEPNALATELLANAPVSVAPSQIAIGIPSDLIRRRPDIRRAERQLAAGNERIGVAIADQFPRVTLNGSIALQSSEASDLLNMGSRAFSFGPSVSVPLFNAGALRAAVDVRNAQQEASLAGYESTVLNAFRETEDAIVALQTEQRRAASLRDSVASYREAAGLARDLYRQGLTDFLTVLEAERNLYQREDELVRSELTTATDSIALYKALGGGWEQPAPPTETRAVSAATPSDRSADDIGTSRATP